MNLDKKNMSLFQIFDGKVEGGAEWFLSSNLIHFAYAKRTRYNADHSYSYVKVPLASRSLRWKILRAYYDE